MHKIDGPYHSSNEFVAGPPATFVTPKWLNAVQRELVNIVESAGMELDDATDTQVLTALNKIMRGWETIGTAYDLAKASGKEANSISVSGEGTNGKGVAFSSDGTKMYMVDSTNARVYQYTLSTAWIVSTASYASKSKFVTTEDTAPSDLTFSTDGTKMYVIGQTNDTVYQYALSTAWDVSTATHSGVLKSIVAQETTPTGLAFSTDGTKMYIVGSGNDTVYQYALSTAWDVSTASHSGVLKSVAAQDAAPVALAFKPDGTTMLVLGGGGDTVFQYTLSTAWDVSTASYATKSKDVGTYDTNPQGLALNDDGTKFYIMGGTNNKVFQFEMQYTYTAKKLSWFAGLCWDTTGAAGPANTVPGPRDDDLAEYKGSSAFLTAHSRIQVRRNGAGDYEVRLPSGMTWSDVQVLSAYSATSGVAVRRCYASSTTDLNVTTVNSAGANTDCDVVLTLGLIES